MSPQKPETDPQALAHRAAEELTSGGYQAAQTTALVAIAGALAAKAPPVEVVEMCANCRHMHALDEEGQP